VENMSYFQCPDCGKRHEIFGPSHSQDVMQVTGAPLLVTLPIDPRLNILSDGGRVEEFKADYLTGLTQLL